MSPNQSQREKKILQELQEHGSASIRELAESLDVSAMTIHRDVNKLAADGLVSKTHGEVTLPMARSNSADGCAMCGKAIDARTVFVIGISNNEQKRACCAHCGLMLQEQTEKTWQSMTADFLHGHMISANHAFYVSKSELNVCCVPSVLSFGSKQEAERFAKGFGGIVADMQGTVEYLKSM
ncbi:MAG: DeoR family transcriptional regulator [Chloroflexota bacterium]